MNRASLFTKLEKGLRLLAGLALALVLFQATGVLTYVLNVWPQLRQAPSLAVTVLGLVAVTAALTRSCLWVRIYWKAAEVPHTLRVDGDSTTLSDKLVPVLRTLTRHLITSSILDVLLLPAIFLMDVFFPFTLSSVHIGLAQTGALLLPQTFGIAALILAYLTHQYGNLIRERCQLRSDLELTV
jgi:hypothetical protein